MQESSPNYIINPIVFECIAWFVAVLINQLEKVRGGAFSSLRVPPPFSHSYSVHLSLDSVSAL